MPSPYKRYGRYGAYAAGYGAASRYMPGTTTAGSTVAGAYLGAKLGGYSLAQGPTVGPAAKLNTMVGRGMAGAYGAVAGYALGRASRALFGKSNNRSTAMRSNYGYR